MNRPGLLHFLFLKSILTIGVSKPQHILIRRCWKMILLCNGFHFRNRRIDHRLPCLLLDVIELRLYHCVLFKMVAQHIRSHRFPV